MPGLILKRNRGQTVLIYDKDNPRRQIEITVEKIHRGDGHGTAEIRFLDPEHNFTVLRGELAKDGLR